MLQEKLEGAYLTNQENTKDYEQKLDALTVKMSQVCGDPLPNTVLIQHLFCVCVLCVQCQEQVESSRLECRAVEAQLQKKEVALTAALGKIELLTSEIQAKVTINSTRW